MKNEKIEQFMAVFNTIPTGLFILEPDNDGNVVYVAFNEAALEVNQFEESDYKGLTASQLFHGQFGRTAQEHHLKAYRSGDTCTYEVELPVSGKAVHSRTTLKPHINEQGQVTHIVGSTQEITEERKLAEIQSKAKIIENELQDFIYLAAHDMRSPMKQIAMIADDLRENFQDLGNGKIEAIGLMRRVTEQALSMINKVLEHAQTTGIEESHSKEHLPTMCQTILRALDTDSGHVYRIEECYFEGDCTFLQIILRNLTDNAIKHNLAMDEQLELTISAKNEPSGFCSFAVTDNGRGMPEPHLLFESNSKMRSKSGFGLLAIRKLIRTRGGDIIGTTAEDGKGLSVRIYLPGAVDSSHSEI